MLIMNNDIMMQSEFSIVNPRSRSYAAMLYAVYCRQKTVTAVIFEVSLSFFTVVLRAIYMEESERIKSANYFFRIYEIVNNFELVALNNV